MSSVGELQPARWEVAVKIPNQLEWKILENRITLVREKVEELTGLDYHRFTRSMLLAQGGFASFLQASPSERAPILEQITGTEIYGEISKKVHERKKLEQQNLEILQMELQAVPRLSAEESSILTESLQQRSNREGVLAQQLESRSIVLRWLKNIESLTIELCNLENKMQNLKKRKEAFAPSEKRLERANRALVLDMAFAELSSIRQQQQSEEREQASVLLRKPEAEAIVKNAEETIVQNQKILQQRNDELSLGMQVIRSVREVDTRIVEKKQHLRKASEEARQSEKKLREETERTLQILSAIQSMEHDYTRVQEYIQKHAIDQPLTENLSAIRRLFDTLLQTHRECQTRQSVFTESEKLLGQIDKEWKRAQNDQKTLLQIMETVQKKEEEVSESLMQQLQGKKIQHWQEELEGYKERGRLLESLIPLLSQIFTVRQRLEVISQQDCQLQKACDMRSNDIESLMDQIKTVEAQVELLERELLFSQRIRDLEEERKHLIDGKPCPLCGSTQHPYSSGTIPAVEGTQQALNIRKQEAKRLNQSLSVLHTDQTKEQTVLQHLLKEKEEKQQILTDAQQTRQEILLKIGSAILPQALLQSTQEAIKEQEMRIQTLQVLEEQLRNLQNTLKGHQEKINTSQEKYRQIAEKQATIRQTHEANEFTLNHQLQLLKDNLAEAVNEVKACGIAELSLDSVEIVYRELEKRRNRWQSEQKQYSELGQKIIVEKNRLQSQEIFQNSVQEDVKSRQEGVRQQDKELSDILSSRQNQFGDKDTDREESRLKNSVLEIENALENCKENGSKAREERNKLETRIVTLTHSIENRKRQIQEMEENFLSQTQKQGFENEEDYVHSRMDTQQRAFLAEQEKALNAEETQLAALFTEKTQQLEQERQKNLIPQEKPESLVDIVATIQEEIQTLQKEANENLQTKGAILQQLQHFENNEKAYSEKLVHVQRQKEEYRRWELLHDLIGSADGNKFRNFAQGLTFEMMIAHANQQLQKMTDRYLLLHDKDKPLELNVLDQYQAGEVRSIKNLSGGESFIVSLALALGLSQMSSRKVRVDSLFLDEGFGTLDEEALETALATLSSLHRDGKLIGVISHVLALKERIATQIQVIATGGGKSIILGPGCRQNA